MKKIFGLIMLSLFFVPTWAQEVVNNESENFDFVSEELKLNKTFQDAFYPLTEVERLQANSDFIPALVKFLKHDNSFNYPFKNLEGMSIIAPPDSSFRIFTWAVPLGDKTDQFVGVTNEDKTRLTELPDNKIIKNDNFKYYGAIQFNMPNLKLIPLFDKSADIKNPEDQVLKSDNWFGALYYNITENEYRGTKYYTLFGWDGNSPTSTIKLVDVLYFDAEQNAIFGAPIFEVYRDNINLGFKNRMLLQFKKGAGVALNYFPEREAIVYDFLAPEDEKAKGNHEFYIPDGTYEGLKFKDGVWKYQDKVFFETLNESQLSNVRPDQKRGKKAKKRVKSKYGID
ncbi:MAG: hypothetical protein R2798_02925 [Chitinophagales bacterium]|nr:hypothetical protein [Bacteroidota bacterium]MCB9042283.1 hypothetical protein [Chitinophagales bacterium]